ncbi:hypothetical protein [Umezawaea sp. Da 62-37]|nr:hypothetical protein [Umezawaea sp. Da 62-37]WNV85546.1 hypothetical protein RM788_46760 [Umezawaea sp. Da 62-37]
MAGQDKPTDATAIDTQTDVARLVMARSALKVVAIAVVLGLLFRLFRS